MNYIQLLQAQYISLLDRLVRNHETRATTANPSLRQSSINAFRNAAQEIQNTLSTYAEDDTLHPQHARRQAQAISLFGQIEFILDQPYDGHNFSLICREVSQFLSTDNQLSTYYRAA